MLIPAIVAIFGIFAELPLRNQPAKYHSVSAVFDLDSFFTNTIVKPLFHVAIFKGPAPHSLFTPIDFGLDWRTLFTTSIIWSKGLPKGISEVEPVFLFTTCNALEVRINP